MTTLIPAPRPVRARRVDPVTVHGVVTGVSVVVLALVWMVVPLPSGPMSAALAGVVVIAVACALGWIAGAVARR